MSKNILLTLMLLSPLAFAEATQLPSNDSGNMSPVEAVSKYFKHFNKADKESLDQSSDSPFIFSRGGIQTAYKRYGDSVDFDGLKKQGWAYSKINTSKLIYEDVMSAMVDINFSRFNKDDEVISTTDVTYLMLRKENQWKMKAGFVFGNLSLGAD
ncbi:hypothetical protein N9W64_01085 [Gammaproteobacteria bacterium]|nr:hypothetical protein [Gammaproteobacteria bacterium]MDB2411028.1 hypothetical protein [Gammaproteobacteria bacterium]